jgi:DNA-binding GntR family transcriptional regulator
MSQGILKPGSSIKTSQIIKELGISKTPLRDALISLEAEGFVTILPQRGVIINALSREDNRYIYDVLGGLESKVIIKEFHKIGAAEIAEFNRLNEKMLALAETNSGDFKEYNDCNLSFHDVFLRLNENPLMLKYITILKQRLYDFPRRDYGTNWMHRNVIEHQQFIKLVEEGNAKEAADFMRDVHWILH